MCGLNECGNGDMLPIQKCISRKAFDEEGHFYHLIKLYNVHISPFTRKGNKARKNLELERTWQFESATPAIRKSMEAISTNSSARENSRLALSIFPSSCVQTATTSVQKYNKSQNKSCHDVQLSNNKSTAVNCVFMAK